MLDAHVSPFYTRLAHVAVHAFSDATQAVMLSPREHMPCCSARYIVILINNVASVAGCCLLACCGGVLPLPLPLRLRLRLRSRLYLNLTIRYPVMKLYHCKDARSLRALWTLEEMGLAYELVNMKFPPRALIPVILMSTRWVLCPRWWTAMSPLRSPAPYVTTWLKSMALQILQLEWMTLNSVSTSIGFTEAMQR